MAAVEASVDESSGVDRLGRLTDSMVLEASPAEEVDSEVGVSEVEPVDSPVTGVIDDSSVIWVTVETTSVITVASVEDGSTVASDVISGEDVEAEAEDVLDSSVGEAESVTGSSTVLPVGAD